MQILISDSSALIDLQKGGILELLLKLPFEFVIPDALIESELLSFSKREIHFLKKNMSVAQLDGAEVEKATSLVAKAPALSIIDAFALIVAETHPGCILLTGDRRLRLKAEEMMIECHGVLWIIEQLVKLERVNSKLLLAALKVWETDPLVRLPIGEIERLILVLKAR